jgi:hypothetical protein
LKPQRQRHTVAQVFAQRGSNENGGNLYILTA